MTYFNLYGFHLSTSGRTSQTDVVLARRSGKVNSGRNWLQPFTSIANVSAAQPHSDSVFPSKSFPNPPRIEVITQEGRLADCFPACSQVDAAQCRPVFFFPALYERRGGETSARAPCTPALLSTCRCTIWIHFTRVGVCVFRSEPGGSYR